MADRVIAIGDIHGCLLALQTLLNQVQPATTDTVVPLGDYINRGPDGRGVIEELIRLRDRCRLAPLVGNHDQLLLSNRATRTQFPDQPPRDPENGLELFQDEHFQFLESCLLHYEIDTHFFVHANYDAGRPLGEQDPYTLLWLSLDDHLPKRHCSGKIAVTGHSSQRSGNVLNCRHVLCIDTYCHGGGWLTALDVRSGQIWQANQQGEIRDGGI